MAVTYIALAIRVIHGIVLTYYLLKEGELLLTPLTEAMLFRRAYVCSKVLANALLMIIWCPVLFHCPL